MKQHEDHPLAAIFPLMTDAELKDLAADIEANGLRDNIWLYEGKVLDGRNRYRACLAADADPRFQEYRGPDPLGFVVSKNLHRRHLTTSQRAMVAAKLSPGERGGDRSKPPKDGLPTTKQAADLFGVAEKTVERAKKVRRAAPKNVVEAVEKGEMTVGAAEKAIKPAPKSPPPAPKPPVAQPTPPQAVEGPVGYAGRLERALAALREIEDVVATIRVWPTLDTLVARAGDVKWSAAKLPDREAYTQTCPQITELRAYLTGLVALLRKQPGGRAA